MRSHVRLISARAWIARVLAMGRQVRSGDYAARYGVDRYTAYQELVRLGCPVAPGNRKYAVRPPHRRRIRRSAPRYDPGPPDAIEWGGELMMVMGWTSGGAPYGLNQEEMEGIFGQEEIKPPVFRGLT